MRVTELQVDGYKGIHSRIGIHKPCVLLTGPNGSGKSAHIEALRRVMGLPARHGDQHLERLSATGSWGVGVVADGRRFEFSVAGGTRSYVVNGHRVNATEYPIAVQTVLQVQHAHVDLGEFLALSGQKRADLFARVLASEPMEIEKAVDEALTMPWRQFARALLGPDAERMGDPLARIMVQGKASSAVLFDRLKELCNEIVRDERTQRAAVANLERDLAAHPARAENAAELQTKVDGINQQIGGAQSRVDEAERQRGAHAAAVSMVDREDERIRALKNALVRQRTEAAKDLAPLEHAVATARKAFDNDTAVMSKATEAVRVASEALDAARRTKPALMDLALEEGDVWDDGLKARMMEGAPEWLAEAWPKLLTTWLEWLRDRRKGQLEAHTRAVQAAEVEVDKVRKQREICAADLDESEHDLDNAERALEGATKAKQLAVQNVAVLEGDVASAEAHRNELAKRAQEALVPRDVEAESAVIASLREQREDLARRIATIQRLNALSGQLEHGRLEEMVLAMRVKFLKEVVKRFQEWRDKLAGKAMTQVMGPLQERLALVMPDATIQLRASGAGRSTVFDFAVVRDGVEVSIEHLSAGETVLVAAAFLATMQALKEGPGTILTMDADALDEQALQRAIETFPRLGFDLVVIATARVVDEDVQGWQVVRCPTAHVATAA